MDVDLCDVAISTYRLERWLDNLNAERKLAAKSSLRTIRQYLDSQGIETIDLVGQAFDPGMAIEVVNNETPDIDEGSLIISEMVAPIVMQQGSVIRAGKVVLGTEIKAPKQNNERNAGTNSTANKVNESKKIRKARVYELELLFDGRFDKEWAHIYTSKPVDVLLLDNQNYKYYSTGKPYSHQGFYQNVTYDGMISIPYPAKWYFVLINNEGIDDVECNIWLTTEVNTTSEKVLSTIDDSKELYWRVNASEKTGLFVFDDINVQKFLTGEDWKFNRQVNINSGNNHIQTPGIGHWHLTYKASEKAEWKIEYVLMKKKKGR